MRVIDHVTEAFEAAAASKWEAALMQACVAIDGTAKKLYPSEIANSRRYKRCVRDYLWLIEPMMGVAFNLVDTKFTNVQLGKNTAPDFADLVYEFRCNHTHGDEVSPEFSMTPSESAFRSNWIFAANSVRMPDKIVWALISVAVFSHVNGRFRGDGHPYLLSWGEEEFPIAEWWGREKEIKVAAQGWNTSRLELRELSRLNQVAPSAGSTIDLTLIAPPHSGSVPILVTQETPSAACPAEPPVIV